MQHEPGLLGGSGHFELQVQVITVLMSSQVPYVGLNVDLSPGFSSWEGRMGMRKIRATDPRIGFGLIGLLRI